MGAFKMIAEACNVTATLFNTPGTAGTHDGGGVMASAEAQMRTIITNGMNAMQGVGLAIALLFFIISMIELAQSERFTLEVFIKFFAKLVIAIALIFYCDELVTGIHNFGGVLTDWVAGINLAGTSGNVTTIIDGYKFDGSAGEYFIAATKGVGWIMMIFEGILITLIMSIVCLVVYIISYIIALTRLLEMGVRGVFLPVAFGLIADDGWRGAGGRYIRKYLAVVCQSAVLVLIGKIMGTIIYKTANEKMAAAMTYTSGQGVMGTLTDMGTPFGLLFFCLGVAIAGVSVMFKSIGIINDVFGA